MNYNIYMKYVTMWVFLIARESKSISELMPSHLAYEKYNYAQRYNVCQGCQMSLIHLWWLQYVWWLQYTWLEQEQFCLQFLEATVASGWWDVISALPVVAVPGAPSKRWFAQVALAAAADGMAGGGQRSWKSILIFFPGAPVTSPEPCPVKVKESLIPALQTIPAPGRFSLPGRKWFLCHLYSLTSCLIKLQPHATHSTHQLPTTTTYG